MGFKLLTVIAVGVTLSCAPGSQAPAESANEGDGARGEALESGDFDAEKELTREAEGLTEQSFQKGPLSFKVPASGQPSVKQAEGSVQVVIPVADGGTVDCFLYDEDPDPGALLMHMLASVKKVGTLRELRPGTIDVEHDSPVVRLTALYTVQREEGLALGQFKLALHNRYQQSSLCLHDRLGFSKTFHETSTAFFRTLEAGRQDLAPSYTEVSIGILGDMPVGYERSMIFVDGKGERRVSANLLFLLRSASEMVTTDSVSSSVIDKQGRIVSAQFYESESGSPSMQLTLERRKGGQYHYEGLFKGKQIQGEFKHDEKAGLPGAGLLEKELKKRAKKAGNFSITHTTYDPGEDPTRPTKQTFTRAADDPPNRVRLKYGEIEMVGTVDAAGRFHDGEAKMGRMTVRFKRIHERGKP